MYALPIGNFVGSYQLIRNNDSQMDGGHVSDCSSNAVVLPVLTKYTCAYCENAWQVATDFVKSTDAKAMEEIAMDHFTRRVLRSDDVCLVDSQSAVADVNRCSRVLGSITLCDSCVNYFVESERRIMSVQKNYLDKMKGHRDFMEVLADPWLDLKKLAFHKLRGIEDAVTERLNLINRMQPEPSCSTNAPSSSSAATVGTGLLTTVPTVKSNGAGLLATVSKAKSNGSDLLTTVSTAKSNGSDLLTTVSKANSNGSDLLTTIPTANSNGTGLLTTVQTANSNSIQPQILIDPEGFSIEDSNRNGCSADPTRQESISSGSSTSSSDSSFAATRAARHQALSPHSPQSMDTMEVSGNSNSAPTPATAIANASSGSESQSSPETVNDETTVAVVAGVPSDADANSSKMVVEPEPDERNEMKTPTKNPPLARRTGGVPAKYSPVVKLNRKDADARSSTSSSASATPESKKGQASQVRSRNARSPAKTTKRKAPSPRKGKSKAKIAKRGKAVGAARDKSGTDEEDSDSNEDDDSESDPGEKTEPIEEARKGKAKPKSRAKAKSAAKPPVPPLRPMRSTDTQSPSTSKPSVKGKVNPKPNSSLELEIALAVEKLGKGDGNETDFSTRSAPPNSRRRPFFKLKGKKPPETIVESSQSMPTSPAPSPNALVFAKKSAPPPIPPADKQLPSQKDDPIKKAVATPSNEKSSGPSVSVSSPPRAKESSVPANQANKPTSRFLNKAEGKSNEVSPLRPAPTPGKSKPNTVEVFLDKNNKVVEGKKNSQTEKLEPSSKNKGPAKSPKKVTTSGRVLSDDSSDENEEEEKEPRCTRQSPMPIPESQSPKKSQSPTKSRVSIGSRQLKEISSSDSDSDSEEVEVD